jgi:hypothetical protein
VVSSSSPSPLTCSRISLALASRADSGGDDDDDDDEGLAAARGLAYDEEEEEDEEAVAGREGEFLDDPGAGAAAAADRGNDAGFVGALLLRPLEKDEAGRCLSDEYSAGLLDDDDSDADAGADDEEGGEEEGGRAREFLVVCVCFFCRSEVVDCKTTGDDAYWLHREGEVGTKAWHEKGACDPKRKRRRRGSSSSITATCRIRRQVCIVGMIR